MLVLVAWAVQPAWSQAVDGGTVTHGPWPAWADTDAAKDEAEAYDLLPFLDGLTLDYSYYHLADGEPRLEVVLEWTDGSRGVRDGRIVSHRKMPNDVILSELALASTIMVDDTEVGELVLDYTALALGPAPETRWHVASPEHWATLFPSLSDDTIALLFERGFTLEALRIEHIAFAVADPSERPIRVYPGRPPVAEEVIGRGAEAVIWGTAGRPAVAQPPRTPTAKKPRPETTGRSTGTRSERGSRSGGDSAEARPATRSGGSTPVSAKSDGRREQTNDDEEDGDEANLLPIAMAAFTVVGVVGAAGGSLGYYATYETPFGLSAGLAARNGGVLLMASINEAVLNTGPNQKLNAQALFFRRLGSVPIQPAVGLGALAETEPGTTSISFGLSFGGVVPLGPLLLHGGYDVLHDDVELGVALDFGRMR
ncbi:MAG: hypothetical protein RhofKO_02270 [Rhodothermales bacterium]